MIPLQSDRFIKQSELLDSAQFNISEADSAHIMTILRDTLYSDKILAVLREYGANAWDAHRAAGKDDVPIEVLLPSSTNPTLSIRDFGHGLSKQDVLDVFTQYGRSTKRESNEAVGMLGIGSKSAFAYVDSFTITSWNAGQKSMYVAALDESEKGKISMLHTEPCEDGETGLMIQIAVKQSDIAEFCSKAKELFQFFVPRPIINTSLDDDDGYTRLELKSGTLLESARPVSYYNYGERKKGLIALMGCIPYRIDENQITGGKDCVSKFVSRLEFIIPFKIGELHVSASREQLKYSDSTKRVLIDRINEFITELVQHYLADVRQAKTQWEQMLASKKLRSIDEIVPKEYLNVTRMTVPFHSALTLDDKKLFRITAELNNVDHLYVDKRVRLVIKDDRRALKGFNFGSYDYVVKLRDKNFTLSKMIKRLDEIINVLEIQGIPIVRSSELSWSDDYKPPKPSLVKGRRLFMYVHHGRRYSRYSSRRGQTSRQTCAWENVSVTPTSDDVFVRLTGLKPDVEISYEYSTIVDLLGLLNIDMPTIYGYRVSEKSKQQPDGIHYSVWRSRMFEKASKIQTIVEQFENWCWGQLSNIQNFTADNDHTKIVNELGKDHCVSQFIEKAMTAAARRIDYKKAHVFEMLSKHNAFKDRAEEPQRQLKALQERYPLFVLNIDLRHTDAWVHYIKLVDKEN